MKKLIFGLLAIILISAVILAGCAPAPAPKPAPAPAPAPAPVPVKPIELKLAHHDSITGPGTAANEAWKAEVEKATGGKVKITTYPTEQLFKGPAAYDSVLNKVTDIAWGFIGFYPGRFPLSDILSEPCLGVPNSLGGSLAMWNNFKKFPEMQAEYKDVKLLLVHTHQGAPIGTKKPVKVVDDLKGMKIRTPAGGALNWLKAAGASPITMPPSGIYESMEKGVIDGWTIDLIGAEGFKLNEVTGYYISPYYYVGTFWLVMNKDVWNSLPADVQKAIDGVSGESGIKNIFSPKWDNGEKEAITRMKIKPEQINKYSDAEWAKAQDIAKASWDVDVAAIESKGLPARKVLDETLSFLKSYK